MGTFKAESQTRKVEHVCPRRTDWSNRTLTSYSQETTESKRNLSYPYHTPLPSTVKGAVLLSRKRMGKRQVAGQVQTARDPKTWFASQLHTASDKTMDESLTGSQPTHL